MLEAWAAVGLRAVEGRGSQTLGGRRWTFGVRRVEVRYLVLAHNAQQHTPGFKMPAGARNLQGCKRAKEEGAIRIVRTGTRMHPVTLESAKNCGSPLACARHSLQVVQNGRQIHKVKCNQRAKSDNNTNTQGFNMDDKRTTTCPCAPRHMRRNMD